jgi:RNA polymerase sigma factor (sigma-70 family)
MNTSFTAIADDRLIFASRAGLVRQAQRLVGPADAEDVVQDAFERALRARSLGAGRDPRPWLRRITRNVAFDRLRTRSRDASVTTDAPAVESAEGIVLRSEAGAELAGLLRALPPAQRRAITLHDIEGYSSAEIASIEGIPHNTVRTRLYRARQAVRSALRPEAA